MDKMKLLRTTLWISFPFNFLAGYILADPASALGRAVGLPASVPPAYATLSGFLVCLFGAAYAWLACQREINRPLLAFGTLGKFGVFLIALTLWLASGISLPVLCIAVGDLVFAAIWCWWLVGSEPALPAGARLPASR